LAVVAVRVVLGAQRGAGSLGGQQDVGGRVRDARRDGGAGVKRVHVDGGGAGHVGMRADRFSRYLSGAGHQQAVGGHAIVGSIRHFRFLRIAEPDVEAGAGRLLGAHVQPVVLVAAELVLGVQARVRP
ncbi:hypothetical protein EG866_15830, partial [Enterococcus faecalis]